MYSGVISRFVDAVGEGRNPTVFGDGRQTRDFVYVEDVVRANLLAMQAPDDVCGRVFNIGTGRQTSLLDLLAALEELAGGKLNIEFMETRAGDIKHSVADISLAGRALGYEPRCDIRDGLKQLLEG